MSVKGAVEGVERLVAAEEADVGTGGEGPVEGPRFGRQVLTRHGPARPRVILLQREAKRRLLPDHRHRPVL